MGQPGIGRAGPAGRKAPRAGRRADVRYLLLLAGLTVGLRAWQLAHSVVISRDAIGYIRIAWALGHGDWRQEIARASQHPGYPLAVLGLSYPVRHFLPDDPVRAMELSAQLAAALASVVFVVPAFYLGREFFRRRVALGAVLLFQALPVSGRLMGDGLSESLF